MSTSYNKKSKEKDIFSLILFNFLPVSHLVKNWISISKIEQRWIFRTLDWDLSNVFPQKQ